MTEAPVSPSRVRRVTVRSVLNRHKRRDPWFLDDYSVNPYESCSFNCLYCYIRGSTYGENLSRSLAVKENAEAILGRQLALRARKGEHGFVVMASATDAYIPLEATECLSRRFLERFLEHRFPVHIITRSGLVERDFDLLAEIDRRAVLPNDLKGLGRGTIISFSIASLDPSVTAVLEPGAPPPAMRLAALRRCREAGFLTGINNIPVLPFISDSPSQLEDLILRARDHGADYVLTGGLTLFGNGRSDSGTLYRRFLQNRFPEVVAATEDLYRGGNSPSRAYHNRLRTIAGELCAEHGIRNSILSTGEGCVL